jgi:hypothetical protein
VETVCFIWPDVSNQMRAKIVALNHRRPTKHRDWSGDFECHRDDAETSDVNSVGDEIFERSALIGERTDISEHLNFECHLIRNRWATQKSNFFVRKRISDPSSGCRVATGRIKP